MIAIYTIGEQLRFSGYYESTQQFDGQDWYIHMYYLGSERPKVGNFRYHKAGELVRQSTKVVYP